MCKHNKLLGNLLISEGSLKCCACNSDVVAFLTVMHGKRFDGISFVGDADKIKDIEAGLGAVSNPSIVSASCTPPQHE